MIKDTELRKGNLVILHVNYKDVIHRVDEIYTDEVKVTSIEDNSCFPLMSLRTGKPIPLDPEWLKRCGFVKNTEDSYDTYLTYSILKLDGDLAFMDGGWFLHITDIDGYHAQNIGRKIEYVHQLQNLYFVLTGEDLEIKPI